MFKHVFTFLLLISCFVTFATDYTGFVSYADACISNPTITTLSPGTYTVTANVISEINNTIGITDITDSNGASAQLLVCATNGGFGVPASTTITITEQKKIVSMAAWATQGYPKAYSVSIVPLGNPPVLQGPFDLTAPYNVPFSYTATATGSTPITYTYSIHFPVTPTANFSFTATATNAYGSDTKTYNVTVTGAPAAPVLQGPFALTAIAGQPFSYSANATGTAPISYSYSINFPFTPTGNFTFTATATNSVGSDTKTYTVTVSAPTFPPVLQGPFTLNGTAGVPFSYSAVATGTAPITYSYSMSFPFTPTVDFTFTVTATNSAGSDTKTYFVTVSPGAPDMTTTNTKLDALEDLIKQTNALLATLATAVDNIGFKIDNIGAKIDITNTKLDTIGGKIDLTNTKLDNISTKTDSMDTHLENIDRNTEIIKNDINGIQTELNIIGGKNDVIITNLEDMNLKLDTSNSKLTTINSGIIMANEALTQIVTNSTSTDIHVTSIDSKLDQTNQSIEENGLKLDNMTDLLQEIAENTGATAQNTGNLTPGSIVAPSLPSLNENTALYTDDQVKNKATFTQWDFIKTKMNGLKDTQVTSHFVYSLPFPGVPDNSGIIISEDTTLAPYIAGCRALLQVIVWLVGLYYWLTIFMGVFV